MGLRDEITTGYGDDFFHPATNRAPVHNWAELCVCGHIDRYHSDSAGGQYKTAPTSVKTIAGAEWTVGEAFYGCVGALPARGFEAKTPTPDREKHTNFLVINPTCPCVDFRPVVKVDRPNRFFNQRIPQDRTDHDRHPFMVGIRAFMTHLSKRNAAKKDPAWADRELARRFMWIEGKRVCGLSRCKETDGVFPIYVDGERSELRCGPHRSRP